MNPTDPYPVSVPEGRPFDVVGFGLNAVDRLHIVPRYPEPGTKVRIESSVMQCGGQVATAMATLVRLGVERVRYVGKVGSDALGEMSLRTLREAGVDTEFVRVEQDSTNQYAVILVERSTGERTIAWHRDPKLMYREGELSRDAVVSGRLLHLDGHDVRASIQAARWAREEGIPVVLDIETVRDGTEELIALVDFVVAAASFPGRITGCEDPERSVRALQARTPAHLVVTLGAQGAIALLGDRVFRAAGFPVEVVDTTGAGDVFHGAFVYGLLAGWNVERILRFSNAAAALSCRKLGARAGIPDREEVLEFLAGSVAGRPRR